MCQEGGSYQTAVIHVSYVTWDTRVIVHQAGHVGWQNVAKKQQQKTKIIKEDVCHKSGSSKDDSYKAKILRC